MQGRVWKIFKYTALAVMLLLALAYLTVQLPPVQRYVISKAVDGLNETFDADISIGKISLKPFTSLVVKDLAVIDRAPSYAQARDTLLYVGNLSARFSLMSLIGPGHEDFIIDRVKLDDVLFCLVIEDKDPEYATNLNRMFHFRRSDPKKEPKERDIFNIRHMEITNGRATMQNFTHENRNWPSTAIDWDDLQVFDLNAVADDFRMSHGLFYADLKHMSLREKCGWNVTHFAAKTISGKGDSKIYDIRLEDSTGSFAEVDYRMLGHNEDFTDYVNRVHMEVDVKDSRLSLSTLSRFIPPLNPDTGTFVCLTGQCNGPVCDLQPRNAKVWVENSSISAYIGGRIGKLPEYRDMTLAVDATDVRFKTADVAKLLHAIAPSASLPDFGRFGSGKLYDADLKVRGSIDNMACALDIRQGKAYGGCNIKADIKNILRNRAVSAEGSIASDNLDLGILLENKLFGPATLRSDFTLKLPYNGEPLEAGLRNIDIKEISVKDYAYHDISGSAYLLGDQLNADIHSEDANCDADFTVWTEKYAYNGSFNIRKADLNAMNIDKRDKSEVAMNLYGHMDRDFSNLTANATLTHIRLTNSTGTQRVSDITLSTEKRDGIYDVSVESDEFSGSFHGNSKELTAEFNTYNATNILAYLMPGAYIDSGTSLRASMDADGNIDGDIKSHRLALKENYIRDLRCKVTGTLKDLDANLEAEEIRAAGFTLNNNTLNVCYVDSVAKVDFKFFNDSPNPARGDVSMDVTLGKHKRFAFDIKPSEVYVSGETWKINESFVQIQGRNILVDDLAIGCNDQWITVNGRISDNKKDVMLAKVHNLDISVFNNFIEDYSFNLTGRMDADAAVQSPFVTDIPDIDVNVLLNDIRVGDAFLGRFTAACDYDGNLGHFYISANQRIEGTEALQANAIYNPSSKNLDASISLDNYPFDFAQRFIPSVFDEMKGKLSGMFFANGRIDELDISSRDARVDDAKLSVAYTCVPYFINGTLHLDNSGIHLDEVSGTDRFGSKVTAHGGLDWDRGRNMYMNVGMEAENVELMNIPKDMEDAFFYGNIFGSGTATVKGPFTGLTLAADMRATGNSDIHFSTSDTENAARSNLLTFVDPKTSVIDPYEHMLMQIRDSKRRNSEFRLDIHAEADPSFTAYLDFGYNQFSSGAQGNGNGVIDIFVNTSSGEYSILGDYILTEGKVEVSLSNLVRKQFQVESGSSIRFQGDVFDSTVDINAYYETKASISSLIADDEGYGNRRSVFCGINVTNNLRNPDIKFKIQIPDLNPSIKTQVESALSTDDKVQKQFLSLLLSNNFLPDEQSGIVNNSSLLFSNVSEAMANQVNNIFNKLDIPLDLGLNYQYTDNGANLFDVALSTQLFNNRVIIGGSFGNRQNVATNAGVFFGDFDVQYKVTRNGAFRIKAFSHSADQYSNFLDNGQRNGIGLSWQQEFDTWPEWFRKISSDKAQREALSQAEANKVKAQKTIILDE